MPPENVEFFIDRCLGSRVIADALTARGFIVHVHDDHFPQHCNDEDWLADVGRRGWVVLSKDGRIERRQLELEALKSAGVAAFIVISSGLDGPQTAEVIVRAMTRIRRLLSSFSRPLLGRVYRSGEVKVVLGNRRGGVRRER